MRSTVKSLVIATTIVGVAAACTPPMPPDVLAARAERTITCVDGNQDVAVDPVFFEAVGAVSSALQTLCPNQVITAVAPDQAASVRILDHAPVGAELAELEQQCAGDLLITPVYGTPIVMAFNIVGLDGLLLTPEAIAGILSGRITSWADPLITEPNSGFEVPDIPVSLQRLNGPSGAVEAMTAWLSQQAPQAWTEGEVSTLTAGTGHDNYEAILAAMSGLTEEDLGLDGTGLDDTGLDDTAVVEEDIEVDLEADVAFEALPGEGTVAVLPAFLANTNVIPIADLPVNDVPISITNVDLPKVGIAAMGLTTDEQGRMFSTHAIGGVPVPEQFDIASAKVIVEEGQELAGWPVVEVSSIVVCDDPNNPLPLSTGQFFLRLGGQGTFDSVGLTPLPEPIRVQAIPAMRVVLDDLADDSINIEEGLGDQTPIEQGAPAQEPPTE